MAGEGTSPLRIATSYSAREKKRKGHPCPRCFREVAYGALLLKVALPCDTPYNTPSVTKKSRGGLNAPTHRYEPPILHILYPHLKRGGAPPVESLMQLAKQEARQRGNSPIRRYTPSTQPKPPTKSSKPTSKRAVRAQGLAPLLRNGTTLEHLLSTRAQGGSTIMVVWRAVIGRMMRRFSCRVCCRYAVWSCFWVRVWAGCIITTSSAYPWV